MSRSWPGLAGLRVACPAFLRAVDRFRLWFSAHSRVSDTNARVCVCVNPADFSCLSCILYSSVSGDPIEGDVGRGYTFSGTPRAEDAKVYLGPSMSIGQT